MLRFVDIDFEDQDYIDKFDTNLYGQGFLKIMNVLSDIAIEESLYADDEEKSRDQDNFLSLLEYLFRTVQMRTLIKAGFKQKHLQFLIIHFANSNHIPKVNLSILFNRFLIRFFFIL